jgi:hypothetical protein
MSESAIYNVMLSGKLLPGFETDRVIDAFAKAFKLSPEQACSIVGTEYVVKREAEQRVAKTYQGKLAAIGLDVVLKPAGGSGGLSLEPLEIRDEASGESLKSGEMVCPKCQQKQEKAEQCSACGVYIHKVKHLMEQAPADEQAAG